LGDGLARRGDFTTAFMMSAGLCLVSLALAAMLANDRPVHGGERGASIHRASLVPGLVLMAGIGGFTVWNTLITPYADDRGGPSAGVLFAVYAAILFVIRLTNASLPDRIGHLRSAACCVVAMAIGVASLAAGLPTLVGTIGVSLGMSLLYPALLAFTVNNALDGDRPAALSTFTAFFEVGSVLGAVVAGEVADLFTDRTAFGVGAALTMLGLIPLRTLRPQPGRTVIGHETLRGAM
jgi:predicted MFS family arabinose efflux permease